MKSYYDLRFPTPEQPTAVAVGFFDGLHIGHKAVITSAVEQSEKGLLPAVFTFTMGASHPSRKSADGYALITPEEKCRQMENWGVGLHLCPDFVSFCGYTPEAFVTEVLVRALRTRMVFCGTDFRFGKNAAGDVNVLRGLCEMQDIEVYEVLPVRVGGERVSSTGIRQMIRQGKVDEAAEWLGRYFGFDFPVEQGKRLGRRLGFPTLNQPLPPEYVAIARGVYASMAQIDGQWRPAVTNVGTRPTVERTTSLCAETYVPDYSGDLYGRRVKVRLLRFVRPERRFPGVQALQEQIMKDVQLIGSMSFPPTETLD